MKTLILILILIGGTMSCKSNTNPSKELNNIPEPTEPTQKDTPEAKAWLDKVKGKTFKIEERVQSGTYINTFKFLENGNMEYSYFSIIDEKEGNTTGTKYFWGARGENKGIYYEKDENDGEIYYVGYFLSNDGKTLFRIEDKDANVYTNPSSIPWDNGRGHELATLVE